MEKNVGKLKSTLSMAAMGVVLMAALFLARGWLGGALKDPEAVRSYISSLGALGPLMLMVIQALQVVVPVMPGFVGCMVGAGLFGVVGGFWCNYIGITAGSLIAYCLARRFGMPFVQKVVSVEKYASWTALANRRTYPLILFLAILLPLTPDDYLCYLSGLIGMSPRRFFWIVVIGKPWLILGYSILFARLF